MSYSKPFEQEREEARDILRWLEPLLHELQVDYEPIDWHHSGVLATIRVNGVEVDTVAGIPCYQDSILNSVRGAVMTDIALQHLGLTCGNHLISQTPVLPEPGTTATWVIHIDGSQGVPVAEYLRGGRRVWERSPFENIRQEEGETHA